MEQLTSLRANITKRQVAFSEVELEILCLFLWRLSSELIDLLLVDGTGDIENLPCCVVVVLWLLVLWFSTRRLSFRLCIRRRLFAFRFDLGALKHEAL